MSSIVKNEDCLKGAIWHQKLVSNKDQTFKKQLVELQSILCSDPSFWTNIKLVEKLLRPLASAILKIEGDQINVRNAFKTVESAFEQSIVVADEFPEDHTEALKEVNI